MCVQCLRAYSLAAPQYRSIQLSSQWNLGRKRLRCPSSAMVRSSGVGSDAKSGCAPSSRFYRHGAIPGAIDDWVSAWIRRICHREGRRRKRFQTKQVLDGPAEPEPLPETLCRSCPARQLLSGAARRTLVAGVARPCLRRAERRSAPGHCCVWHQALRSNDSQTPESMGVCAAE